MARTVYEVVPAGSDWRVKRRDASQAAARRSNKDEAVRIGVRLCKKNTPSQLIIKRQDGTIQDERTYGDDPFPPRG